MTPIAAIEAVATLLWCYAALAALAWFRHARRLEQSFHIAAFAELMGNLVPAMVLLVIVILFGALVGLPSVVVFIAFLFPAGLSWGLHVTLSDLPEGNAWRPRVAIALVLAIALTTYWAVAS